MFPHPFGYPGVPHAPYSPYGNPDPYGQIPQDPYGKGQGGRKGGGRGGPGDRVSGRQTSSVNHIKSMIDNLTNGGQILEVSRHAAAVLKRVDPKQFGDYVKGLDSPAPKPSSDGKGTSSASSNDKSEKALVETRKAQYRTKCSEEHILEQYRELVSASKDANCRSLDEWIASGEAPPTAGNVSVQARLRKKTIAAGCGLDMKDDGTMGLLLDWDDSSDAADTTTPVLTGSSDEVVGLLREFLTVRRASTSAAYGYGGGPPYGVPWDYPGPDPYDPHGSQANWTAEQRVQDLHTAHADIVLELRAKLEEERLRHEKYRETSTQAAPPAVTGTSALPPAAGQPAVQAYVPPSRRTYEQSLTGSDGFTEIGAGGKSRFSGNTKS